MSLLKPQEPLNGRVEAFRFSPPASDHNRADNANTSLINSAVDTAGNSDGLAPVYVAKEADLVARISDLEDVVAASASALEDAKAQAYEDGKAEGLATADKFALEGLERLQEACAQAQGNLISELQSHVDLAIEIAKALIQRVLGDDAQLPSHVIQTAAAWSERLKQTTVLRLRVSLIDFPDEETLTELGGRVTPIQVEADPALETGACVFDLQLGQFDASLPTQLKTMAAFLDDTKQAKPQDLTL